MAQFNFDGINFGIGFASGVLTTAAAYRLYQIAQRMQSQGERAVVRTYASRTADRGYLIELVKYARHAHLMGTKLSLSEVLIEPRFIPPASLPELSDPDEPIEQVFDSVPQVHDFPYLHASYNLPTLSIEDISRGHKALVLVGLQGSGRTTALLTIALWSSGFLDFSVPDDMVAQEYESNRDPKKDPTIEEQAERIRRRVISSESRSLAGKGEEEKDEDAQVITKLPSPYREVAPLYAHLADIVLTTGEYGRNIDPAEPLVRALQQTAGFVASKRLVSKTYKLLEAGSGLVMIDGYDDLPVSERQNALRWIKALMATYPENRYIIAMPPEGYGLLIEAGAMPIYLRPWNDQMLRDEAEKWQAQWQTLYKQDIQFDLQKFQNPDNFRSELVGKSRQLSAFDASLYFWTSYKGFEGNQGERLQFYLKELLPDVENILPELQTLAAIQLDEGYITLREMVEIAITEQGMKAKRATQSTSAVAEAIVEAPRQAAQPMLDEEDLSEFFGASSATGNVQDAESFDEAAAKDIEDGLTKEEEKDPRRRQIANEQRRFVEKLLKAGVLVQHRRGRYQFRHKIIASYLAALSLAEADEIYVVQKYRNPNWDYAMNYLAQLRDVDFLVGQQLSQPVDVLHENVLKICNWLRFSGKEVSWRNDLLRYLGNLMVAQNQFVLVRERVAAALVSSKDDGVVAILRRSMQITNPDVQRIASLALGAIRDKGAVDALTQVVLQAPDITTKIAAVLGLYTLGTEDALEALIDVIDMTPRDDVRRAIGESFAADRNTGYPTLYDMLESDNETLQLTALYGLGRVNTDWAVVAVDKPINQGTNSRLRIVSQIIEQKTIYEASRFALRAYPIPTEAEWLIQWSEEQRDAGNVRYDMPIEEVYQYALEQDHDGVVRWLATGTVGSLGDYRMVDKIYLALQDREESVRNMAYRSLGEFQQRLGKRLPAPLG